jgi:hypothetical protein
MANRKTEVIFDFSDISGGMNSTDPANSLKKNQAQYIRNIFALLRGWKNLPGYLGLSSGNTFDSSVKMLDNYVRTTGDDILIGLAGGKVYSVDRSTNAKTLIYELGGDGEGYGESYQDKYFLANGTGCMKIEGSIGYKLGIAVPAGVTAIATAGGSLADGDYVVYVSYARGNNLYSYAQTVGTITCGAGNNTITVTFPNSSDPQVTNKVVWIKGPSETLIYFYAQTNDNTTTTIAIVDTSTEDTTKLYRILGEQSVEPPALEGIIVHAQSLYGWVDNVLHKSLPGTTVYDLERWPDINYTFPFKITGLLSLGEDLYLNSNQGIYKLPRGEMTAEWTRISKRLYFKYFRTVARNEDNGNYVIGLTNDGVRIFDGDKFSIDLSKDMKPYIDKIYIGSNTEYQPCGIVYNRNFRTEYRISYRNTDISSACNNQQMVLNLDTVSLNSNVDYNAAWEIVDYGFNYATTDVNNTLYLCQSMALGSQIFKENFVSMKDQYIYDQNGTFITTAKAKTKEVKSRVIVPDISYLCDWDSMWIFSQQMQFASAYIYGFDSLNVSDTYTLAAGAGGNAIFDAAIFDTVVFETSVPLIQRCKPKMSLKGSAFYFRYLQENDDELMQVYEVKALAIADSGRYT